MRDVHTWPRWRTKHVAALAHSVGEVGSRLTLLALSRESGHQKRRGA